MTGGRKIEDIGEGVMGDIDRGAIPQYLLMHTITMQVHVKNMKEENQKLCTENNT